MTALQEIFLVFLLFAITLSKSNPINITAERAEELNDEDYRLTQNIVPEAYALDLTLSDDFFTKKTFKGFVKLTLKSKVDNTDSITLNMEGMTLDTTAKPTLYLKSDDTQTNLLVSDAPVHNANLQRTIFKLKTKIEKEQLYVFEITYTGTLYGDMYGFYLSSYVENEQNEWIATTQFQPTYARRAFPCFDEPNFKATFDIVITHPTNYRALSNSKITSSIVAPDGKSTTTTFATTPKMSTYLIAFVISKFASMNINIDSLDNAVWSQHELIETAKYSLDIAPKMLKAMEGFTTVPYSKSGLPKLDQVAIPDFSAGAMENWGLVTYRESALLWDKVQSTAQSKQRVATIVAHELAHMWFGNLITTDWWSATWLNEGFARYFQYYATDKVEKDWELKHQFVLEQQQSILNSDALSSTTPLTSEKVLTREQISDKFGSITYNKGASVIRMMEHIMGEEKFIEGIRKYTSEHHFENVIPKDLWDAMSTVLDVPLPTGASFQNVMEPWTTEKGFPVVKVSEGEEKYVLTANKFFFNKPETESDRSVWYIPITYTTSKNPNFDTTRPTATQWIKPADEKLEIAAEITDDSWIIVNLQSSAYIRVNYDEALWKKIQTALANNYEDIHILNRAQIADDSLNLARANLITYNTAFDVLQYLEKESNYYPWYSAFNGFAYLKRRINDEDDLGKQLNIHISNLMQTLHKNVSFDDESTKQLDIYKKVLALTWACQLGNTECIETAQDLFDLLKEKKIPVQPDLRGVVYCTAMRNSEERDNWDFLWERFTTSNMATEATTIISALGCTKDTTILKEYLEKSITVNSGIRKQDAQSVFTAVISGNHEGVQVGLDFVENNYAKIQEFYGGMNALSGVITSLADRLTTPEQVEQFKQFVETAELGAAQASADNALERCNENLKWVESFGTELLEYLIEKNAGGSTTTTTTAKPGGAASVTVSSAVLFLSILAILKW